MKSIRLFIPRATWTFALMLITAWPAIGRAENLFSTAVTAKIKFQDSRIQNVNCRRENGIFVCDEVAVNVIRTAVLDHRILMNLLVGHSLRSNTPANLVLAVSFGCGNPDNAQLVLFNRSSSNVVRVVADISNRDLISTGTVVCTGEGTVRECQAVDTSFEGFLTFAFRSDGDATHSINGGEITLYAKGTLNSNGCIVKAAGTGSGAIDVTIDGKAMRILVPSFTLTSGRKIAVVP